MILIIRNNNDVQKFKIESDEVEILLRSSNKDTSINQIKFEEHELKILKLVSEGKVAKEIAGEVFLSYRTVESIKEKIRDRLGYKTVIEMIVDLIRKNII